MFFYVGNICVTTYLEAGFLNCFSFISKRHLYVCDAENERRKRKIFEYFIIIQNMWSPNFGPAVIQALQGIKNNIYAYTWSITYI